MTGLGARLLQEIERDPAVLVPPAFEFLWRTDKRYLVPFGGRASAKSWSIARVLISLANERPLRVLCCREIQGSIRESAFRLLADQVSLMRLDDAFDVMADSIVGRNGSRFFFEGLRYNASKIRSYEGVDLVWVEEAQNVSDMSWETLLPTIRKKGSRFFISFNPMTNDDPVAARFVESNRPDALAVKVSWRDNPHLSSEAIAEKDWLAQADPDAYRHVWEGFPRTVSDAIILRGKYVAEVFEVRPSWAGPYHGADYGFSKDPSAAVRCYIDDDTRTLYVSHEGWWLGADIDALPDLMESAIPGISRHVVHCDSARPETTSYLSRNGIPRAQSAEKWPGSVDDGIAFLRSFSRIVIDPACQHLIDECGSYSFKCDRLTGAPLPEPEDKNNHLIDALRYALSPLIRNQPNAGFFARQALLVSGEPLEPASVVGLPTRVFVTLAACESPGTALGAMYWALFPNYGPGVLVALDYELIEFEDLTADFTQRVCARAQELRSEWHALEPTTGLWVEEGPIFRAVARRFMEYVIGAGVVRYGQQVRPPFDLAPIETKRLKTKEGQVLKTLDDRCVELRAAVNGGQFIKLARTLYARQVTHRSVTANHFTNQTLSYRPGAGDVAQELVACLALAGLGWRGLDRRRLTPLVRTKETAR